MYIYKYAYIYMFIKVNAKNALVRERDQVKTQRDSLLNMSGDLESGLAQAQRDLKEVCQCQ
jgi:hypothetical protein